LSPFGAHRLDSHLIAAAPLSTEAYPIRLWRVSVAPGATLRPEPGVVLLAVAAPVGGARIGEGSGDTFRNTGKEPIDLYVMSVGAPDLGVASPTAAASSPLPSP
jgi:hypothetical protein